MPLCELYSLLLCHKGTYVHLISPTPGYWYTSFRSSPGPLHQRAVSAFARRPLGRAYTFSFVSLLSTRHVCYRIYLRNSKSDNTMMGVLSSPQFQGSDSLQDPPFNWMFTSCGNSEPTLVSVRGGRTHVFIGTMLLI